MSGDTRARVRVDRTDVGELMDPGRPEPATFVYAADVTGRDAVSVTMPVSRDAYHYDGLHPVFAQNLPEGYLGDILRRTVAKLHGAGDLTLLAALGRYQVGRVVVEHDTETAPDTGAQDTKDDGESLQHLVDHGGPALFEELVERYALRSGISGVQPKVLVPALSGERATLRTSGFIVKSWSDDFPQLAANEYFCLQVARRAGLPVPTFELSREGRLLIMHRFDRRGDGGWLGFEDGCVLQGLPPEEKYSGSYERLARSLQTWLSSQARQQGMEQLFLTLLVSWAVRNGDAHLKNFGIVYEQPFAVRHMAPAYDIVCTTAYLRHDVPALTLEGRKAWIAPDRLAAFGRLSCGLTAQRIREHFRVTAQALRTVTGQIQDYRRQHPAFAEVGTHMEAVMQESATLLEAFGER